MAVTYPRPGAAAPAARPAAPPDPHRVRLTEWFDRLAPERAMWRARNRFYYQEIERLARQTIPPGVRVLELGCGIGDLLAAVQPSFGVGLDVSREMVRAARRRHVPARWAHQDASPGQSVHGALLFIQGDAQQLPLATSFDYVICSDLVGHLEDIQAMLAGLHAVCTPRTQVLITYWNFLWHSVLWLAERAGWKMPEAQQNWLGTADVDNLLLLTDFQTLEAGASLLVPKPVPLLSEPLNRLATRYRPLHHLALVNHWVVRPEASRPRPEPLTCTVIVPCRNEEDNIADCVDRLPALGTHTELIFVDGASTDRTRDRILEEIARHRGQRDIKLLDQVPPAEGDGAAAVPLAVTTGAAGPVKMLRLGKGDAVRKGFTAASGDVLFILDADLTVPPEDLPKFLEPIAAGKADFVNGTRLVYPLEDEAMRPVNLLGNKFFSLVFTWLLGQRVKDTLCGTKVLRRRDYEIIAANRAYFGDFDPFGDFDLLFGAARAGLRIVEVPVRYRRRSAGYSKVEVYKHGLLLLNMSLIGFRRLKLAGWLGHAGAAGRPRQTDLVPLADRASGA